MPPALPAPRATPSTRTTARTPARPPCLSATPQCHNLLPCIIHALPVHYLGLHIANYTTTASHLLCLLAGCNTHTHHMGQDHFSHFHTHFHTHHTRSAPAHTQLVGFWDTPLCSLGMPIFLYLLPPFSVNAPSSIRWKTFAFHAYRFIPPPSRLRFSRASA